MAWQSRLSLPAVLAATLGVTATSQDNWGEAFYAAIRANDLPRLNGILTAGANVNAKDERSITPLMYTAWVGSVDAMKRLLDHAADPNLSNSSGSTALMLSSTEIAKVRLLIDRGANVNVASTRGRTALFLAAMSDRSADIARLLISAGADVKVVDGMKMTVLHAAALGNDTETVRLLLDAGLDVNVTDFQGFTPLIYASSNGNLAAARLLLAKGADVIAVSGDGSFQKVKAGTLAQGHFTPLIMAAPFGSTELVKTLLDAGAKVNAQDIRGMTPLNRGVPPSADTRYCPKVGGARTRYKMRRPSGETCGQNDPAPSKITEWAASTVSVPLARSRRTNWPFTMPSIRPTRAWSHRGTSRTFWPAMLPSSGSCRGRPRPGSTRTAPLLIV